MHRLTRAALLTATAGVLVGACAVPATAAAAAAPPRPSPTTPSCVVSVGFTPQPTTACYSSLGAALTAATGGTLRNPPVAPAQSDVLDADIDAANASNAPTRDGTVIGIEYFDSEFLGYSWVVTTPSGCGPDSWELDDLGDWNNEISSFRTYAGCRSDHFDRVGYKGASTGLLAKRRYIGDRLNDRASAIRWS